MKPFQIFRDEFDIRVWLDAQKDWRASKFAGERKFTVYYRMRNPE